MPLKAILDHLKSGTESSSRLCPHPILQPTTTATTNTLHHQQSPPTATTNILHCQQSPPTTTTNQSQQPLMPPNTSIHQYHHPPWLLCSGGWLQCGMFVVGGSWCGNGEKTSIFFFTSELKCPITTCLSFFLH